MIVSLHAAEDAFDSLHRHLDDFMDEIAGRSFYQYSRSVVWEPAVNVYEDAGRFLLCVELAGVNKDAIHVEVIDRRVTIRGERVLPEPPEGSEAECLLRMEINSGPFQCVVELPSAADMTRVEAKLDNGYLWVTILKKR